MVLLSRRIKAQLGARSLLVIAVIAFVVLTITALGGYQILNPSPANIEASYVTDFDNPRRLVGFGDNVFIGTVLSRGETRFNGRMPETLFTVAVDENIKGELSGSVLLNQLGGFSEEENRIVLMNNDPLLTVGTTYLFVTKSNEDGTWHRPVSNYGDIPISNPEEYQRLVQIFSTATEEQIHYTGPMWHN